MAVTGRSHEENEMDDAAEILDTDGPREVGNKRGRLKDFSGTEYKILVWAGCVYKALMLVCGMYKTDIDVLDKRRVKAWETACGKFKKSIDNYPFKLSHMQNMNDRLVSWRTHVANYVRDKAAAKYFPKTNPMTSNELKAHIEWLKAGGLHTKPDLAPGEGYFQHPLIQTCMEEMVFQFKKDIGVQFPNLFWQPSAELICFFCAILQFVVEEREIGKTGKADLEFETQQKAYNTHLTSHGVWLELVSARTMSVGVGSSKSTLPVEPKSVLRAEDLQPDNPDPAELAAWEEEMAELTSKKHKDPEGWGGLDYDEASGQDQLKNANKLKQPLVHANEVMRNRRIIEKTLVRKAVLLAPTVKITHIGRIPTTEVTVLTKMRIFAAQSLSTIANASQLWMDIGSATIIVTTGPATATGITSMRQDYNRELSLENHERSNYGTGHRPNNVYTRTRQDRDEYAHFNQIEDCPPNLYWDFGIKPTSGSNYGDDHDENGDARGTPKRMIETSFGEDYPAEFNGEY
ncbi:hypothetical protein RhiXN_08094 [Rhizoctonia solani]|uniref:DUF6532 domain-containing protein n=1 Tax=Rhizoctonia solani TaxID=456999 RepID=A0A8H8P1Y4_9AGAM|nr:uncharacterized protein RhiXN_08094 [Rhizoctonia solani]QRW23058.1 hypothetical protein RhiXN_08094 [Rhizoctonia solani]